MARPKRHREEDAARLDAAVDAADEAAAAPEAHEPLPPAPTPPPIGEATPSMAQFLEIKTANPDSILWYRMGDFYELFFDDAVVASPALGIVLTKRGKHLGQDIPMCGVPVHRADEYLQRLIRLGYRVAVCEQLEDPAEARKRGAKAVVRRDVVRLVTPGTLTEETLLDARARNYLTALFRAPGGEGPLIGSDAVVALASLDISTGEFEVGEARGKDLPGELVRLAASEILVADAVIAEAELRAWIERAGAAATPVPAASFDSLAGERDLKARLGVAELGAFGAFTRAELAAIGGLLRYVDLTQIGKKPVVRAPRRIGTEATLVIDAASRASLELVRSTSGEKAGSLLDAIDRTVTGAGSRELAARLATPLTDPRTIEARLDAVAMLVDDEPLREALRETLKCAPDLARAVSRLAFGRGGPRDLAGIAQGLAAAAEAARHLRSKAKVGIGLPDEIARLLQRMDGHGAELLALLSAAIVDDPPHLRRDGGFVRRGFRPALDEAHALRDDSRRVMAELEARYVEETGIKTLKVRHNNILGYFIEVTQANAKPLTEPPLSDTFRHRQSMANAMRFTTPELSETEGRIASAADRALAIEQEIFNELAAAVARDERTLSDIAAALAEMDHTAALAHLAHHERFVRPVIDNSLAFEIHGGRHPVVEQALHRTRGGPFVANDCILGRSVTEHPPAVDEMPDARVWLVTGPNMAGKSTFLRQNALIAILAQMGSFVPAASAHIGVVDRLFSRVGAADDLARGRSTFMVEMVETAAILNQATARSLVILDEIGRGTATFDGLSIAWAAVEFLHEETEARVLFATHYHELTALAGRLASVANVTMDVKEWHDDIVFLHRVKAGAADRSYGIQVAKLAGLPAPVIARAREVLNLLEKADRRRGQTSGPLEELPLFAAARPASAPEPSGASPVEAALDTMNPDDLSPKAALEALYGLKRLRTGGPAK